MSPRLRVAAALLVVYVVWGSTYAAIRVALQAMPPFLLGGVRFVTAGALLWLFARLRGHAALSPRQVRDAAIVGVMLLCGGNGGVVFAQQHVASGLAAVLVASVPLWMAGFDALHPRGERLTPGTVLGLSLGLVGVGVLMAGGVVLGHGPWFWAGVAAILAGAGSWAAGSIYGRHAERPASSLAASAVQMLAGGAAMLVVGSARGEWPRVHLDALLGRPGLAYAYLIVFGSLVAFSCYGWLLRVARPALVGTYAYVNPAVALLLGALLFDEPLDVWTLAGAAAILGSVVLAGRRRAGPEKPR